MRHLNFRLAETGELLSLDGFNRDTVLTRALIGDSSATLKFPDVQHLFSGYANYTVPGLPINDSELIRALDLVSPQCDRIFLFPSTEMHGAIKFPEITPKMGLAWTERFMEFEPEQRYCVGNLHYIAVKQPDREALLQNYLEIVAGIMGAYPNVYLVPVVSRFLGSKIPFSFRAYPELKKLERCIDLDWLDPDKADFWADSHGHLSRLGWTLLNERLEIV